MDLETSPPSSEKTTSTNICGFGQVLKRTQEETGNRESQTSKAPVSAFYSPQKGFHRRTIDSRPIYSQPVHQLPFLQNVNPQGHMSSPSSRFLDHLHRPAGRILACPNSSKQKTLFGLHLPRPGLAIPGTSVWVKHRPKGLHQTSISCSEGTGTSRYLVPCLFGRSVDNLPHKRAMHPTQTESPAHPCQFGIHSQPPKITPISRSGVYLARNRVESTFTHSAGYTRQNIVSSNISQFHSSVPNVHQTSCHATTRPSKLHRSIRSSGQSSTLSDKKHIVPFPGSLSKRAHTNPLPLETQTLQVVQPHDSPTGSGITSTISHNSDRRLSAGLGFSNRKSKVSWSFRQVCESFNQHTGAPNHMVCTLDCPNKRSRDPDLMRQQNSYCSSSTRQLTTLSALVPSRTDLEKSNKAQLDPNSFTHSREVQYPCRSTVTEHNTVLGMVNPYSNIQTDQATSPFIGSRLVCHTPEQQTTSVRCPLPRSESNSSRCHINTLGTMEPSIPLPTNTLDSQGTGKTHPDIIHKCHFSNSRDANASMVYGASIKEYSFHPTRDTTDSGCSGQDSDSPPTYETSRVDVIRGAYYSRFPHSDRVVDLLANPIRKSSQGDYERK